MAYMTVTQVAGTYVTGTYVTIVCVAVTCVTAEETSVTAFLPTPEAN